MDLLFDGDLLLYRRLDSSLMERSETADKQHKEEIQAPKKLETRIKCGMPSLLSSRQVVAADICTEYFQTRHGIQSLYSLISASALLNGGCGNFRTPEPMTGQRVIMSCVLGPRAEGRKETSAIRATATTRKRRNIWC